MTVQRLAALVLFVAGLAACSDQPTPDPTAPDVKVLFAAGGPNAACGSALGKAVADQQAILYSGATLDAAEAAWNPVVRDCKNNLAAARESMMTYVQFTIANAAINNGQGSNSLTVTHWNSVFAYVGYAQPGADAGVLSLQGGAEVVPNPAVSEEVRTFGTYAAITIYHQSDPTTHLITINPRPGVCITGTNLVQKGDCFNFESYPHVTQWNPEALVGVCQPEHDGTTPGAIDPGLGHQPTPNGAAEILAPVSYPTFCGEDDPIPTGSWNGGLKGIATRLAYIARKALTPRPAYASHTGIGGTGGGISPFAAVDRRIFYATFTADALNLPPGANTPERGTWDSVFAQPPGSILVQQALGTLTAKPVVLSQGGGNCTNCGGLKLKGVVVAANSRTASTGVYHVDWDALEDGPSVKAAPIVLRGTNGSVIARVTLRTKSSKNEILYNGTVTSVPWTQHVSQHFKIVVDFTGASPKTSLFIEGAPVASNKSFVENATDIGSIAADFTGIDSGIVAWDNIQILRLPDDSN